MSKLDWTKADIRESDPARAQRDPKSFAVSDAAKKKYRAEERAKKKTRSAAARKAAVTRKRNREIAAQKEIDTLERKANEIAFFERLRAKSRVRNEARRARREAQTEKAAGTLGKLLIDALKKLQ